MAAGSDAAEVQRVRESLAAAEAALDSLINEMTDNDTASPSAETQSGETATRHTEERAAALADDIARLGRRIEHLRIEQSRDRI